MPAQGGQGPRDRGELDEDPDRRRHLAQAAEAREATVRENKSIFTGLWTGNTVADRQIKEKYVRPGTGGFAGAIENYYTTTDHSFSIAASKAGSEIKTAWQNGVNRVLAGQQKPGAAMAQAQGEAGKAFRAAK